MSWKNQNLPLSILETKDAGLQLRTIRSMHGIGNVLLKGRKRVKWQGYYAIEIIDFYGKAQNLVFVLKEAYDNVLKEVDVLIMPTTPMKAMPIPENPTFAEYFGTAFGMFHNPCPFNCRHHPAMSVPCAKSDGLPIGMMLIGRQIEDDIVLRAAHAFEKAGIYS